MLAQVFASLLSAVAGDGLAELSMPRIMELVGPVLKTESDSSKTKMPENMLRSGRLSVPMPALMLFFFETGCLTAMVSQEDLAKADWQCLEGDSVPTIQDFLGDRETADKHAIILLSPLYNLAALKSVKPSRGEFWDQQRTELDRLQISVQKDYPGAAVHSVYVPFGM